MSRVGSSVQAVESAVGKLSRHPPDQPIAGHPCRACLEHSILLHHQYQLRIGLEGHILQNGTHVAWYRHP